LTANQRQNPWRNCQRNRSQVSGKRRKIGDKPTTEMRQDLRLSGQRPRRKFGVNLTTTLTANPRRNVSGHSAANAATQWQNRAYDPSSDSFKDAEF